MEATAPPSTIGHIEHAKQIVVIDCIREIRPPFSPEAAIGEFAQVLRSYKISKTTGDRWAGGFPPEQFAKYGVLFEQAAKTKSDLYVDLLPLINSKRIELLDHPRLISQLCGLERRTSRGGRDTIDHAPNGHSHDDVCNAVAGLASLSLTKRYNLDAMSDPRYGETELSPEAYRRKRMGHMASDEYSRFSRPVGVAL